MIKLLFLTVPLPFGVIDNLIPVEFCGRVCVFKVFWPYVSEEMVHSCMEFIDLFAVRHGGLCLNGGRAVHCEHPNMKLSP